MSGLSSQISAPIDIQEKLNHTGTSRYVYDIDPEADLQDSIIPYLHSSDIGTNIIWVHNNEVDYLGRTDKIAGKDASFLSLLNRFSRFGSN